MSLRGLSPDRSILSDSAGILMRIVADIETLRGLLKVARKTGKRVVLVPTMGALHEGHASLMRHARELGDVVVASIFVNPLQFGPGEDLTRYPRDLDGDQALAELCGVDLLFVPDASEMLDDREDVLVVAPTAGARLEGSFRPTHFQGVLTIVAKLFNIVSPDVAVFGQKDFQQAFLIKRMVQELRWAIRIHVAPIVRSEDGLALSSRNRYLGNEDRTIALALPLALAKVHRLFRAGETQTVELLAAGRAALERGGIAEVDYMVIVNSDSLEEVETADAGAAVVATVRVSGTRLLDNVLLGVDLPKELAALGRSPE